MKIIFTFVALFLISGAIKAQDYNKIYAGPGIGLDYGGIGAKLEVLPVKQLGLFGGIGYNMLSVGWNVGAGYKILPDKNICPAVSLMYGYNGVIKAKDSYAAQYETTSYGVSLGGGVDIKIGARGKISTYIFVPFRSSEFRDKYDAMKNDPGISTEGIFILPITIGAGYNFAL